VAFADLVPFGDQLLERLEVGLGLAVLSPTGANTETL
jgi:hypothetical protein